MSRIPSIGRGPPTAGTLLSDVITKPRIIGLLAILIVCLLVLRSGNEPCDSGNRSDNAGFATDRRSRPRIPGFPTPSQDHGIVGQSGAQSAPPIYGKRGFYPEQPYPGLDYGGYGVPDPYGTRTRIHTDGYRFRPLAEQAQRHRQAPDPDRHRDRYTMLHNPPPQYQPPPPGQPQQSATPAPYPSQTTYANHPWEIYSFRPLERSPGARGRWQGPYEALGPSPPNPWSPSPPPQWGSTPPSQRMYPSLSPDPDRRLTVR